MTKRLLNLGDMGSSYAIAVRTARAHSIERISGRLGQCRLHAKLIEMISSARKYSLSISDDYVISILQR